MTKEDKKKHHKHHKESKSSKKSSKDKKKNKKSDKEKPSKAHTIEEELTDHQVESPINVTDHYFEKHDQFRVWLRMHWKKRSSVDDYEHMNSEQARKIFEDDFAPAYNSGRLPAFFYEENVPLEMKSDKQIGIKTQHQWNFLRNLTEKDKVQLSDVAEDVDALTRKNKTTSTATVSSNSYAQPCKPDITTSNKMSSSTTKEDKKRMRAVYEDVLPPKELDAKSRMSDQRKATADRLHGAHRQREEDRDGLSGISEDYLMGSNSSSFQSELAKRQHTTDRKQHRLADRAQELAAKQAERDAQFIAQLGIDPTQGRITIRPRDT